MSTAGPAMAFGIAAAGNLVFVVTLVLLPFPGRAGRTAGADHRFRAGFHQLRSDPALICLLVGVAAIGIGSDPAITLTPPLSAELGRGTDLVGPFASAFGAGAIVAFPLMSLVRRRFGEARLTTSGLSLLAVGTLALSVAPTPLLAIAGFAVAGGGMMAGLTSLSTQIQIRVPDHLRGRVMALWAVAFLGSRPPSSALDGWIADAFSVEAAMIIVGLLVALAAWLSRPSRVRPLAAEPFEPR